MMTIRKLSAMPYAQAHIEIDERGNIALFSYNTLAATLTPDGWLAVYCLCSQTTRRHVSAFVREYTHTVDYKTAKYCLENRVDINIHTGEIVDWD